MSFYWQVIGCGEKLRKPTRWLRLRERQPPQHNRKVATLWVHIKRIVVKYWGLDWAPCLWTPLPPAIIETSFPTGPLEDTLYSSMFIMPCWITRSSFRLRRCHDCIVVRMGGPNGNSRNANCQDFEGFLVVRCIPPFGR